MKWISWAAKISVKLCQTLVHMHSLLSYMCLLIALVSIILPSAITTCHSAIRRCWTESWTPRFPCGECLRACTSYKGGKASIYCDSWDTWFHAKCVNLADSMLSILGQTDLPWECCKYGSPNFSSGLFDSVLVDSSTDSLTSSLNPISIKWYQLT